MTSRDGAFSVRRRWLLPVVAIVLTGLAGGVVLWTLQGRQTSGPILPVAIVNSDKPVTTGSGKDQKTVAAGRQVAAGLTQPDAADQTPLSWQIVDRKDADKGLADGSFYAVLTIPENFSSSVTSTSGAKPKEAELKLVSNDASSLAVATIAQLAAGQAAATLGKQVTSSFTDNTLQSLTSIHTSLTSSAQSAHQVDDSAHQLASSSKKLDSSSQSLAKGAASLHAGTESLVAGLKKLDTGAQNAADGAERTAAGAKKVAKGAGSLADGADQSAAGAKKLATGADRLAKSARSLARGADAVQTGSRAVSRGAHLLARSATAGSAVATRLSKGTRGLAADLRVASRLTTRSSTGTARLAALTGRLSDTCLSRTGNRVFCAELSALGRDSGAQARIAGAADHRVVAAAGVAHRVAAGASAVALVEAGVARGADRVSTRSGQVATGAGKVADGVGKLATGTTQLARGASHLSQGTSDVSDGADVLATSAGSVAGGAAKVATGSEQVAAGVAQSEDGAASSSKAAGQLATGASQLATGSDQLASGASQLASGTAKLADGLDNGATSVPSYTDSQRKTLTDAVTTPVGLTATSQHRATVAAGLVPAVLAVALWLGTLMMFLTGGAVPSGPAWAQASATRRVLWGWLPALLTGVLQTAILVGLVAVVGVPIHSTGGLAAFCALGAVAFAATNQALVSLFGGIGRLVSLALILIAAAAIGGLIPIQTAPAFLQTLNGILPVPQFVDGAGQLMLGGISKGLIGACVVLVAWTVGALVVSVVATARRNPELAPGPLPEPPLPEPPRPERPGRLAQPSTT